MYKYLNDTAIELLHQRQHTRVGDHVFMNHKTGKAIGSYQKIFDLIARLFNSFIK